MYVKVLTQTELNDVRVANADWAKNKYAYSADKIDVRLNLISLFRDKPTIQNVKLYNVKVNIEQNADYDALSDLLFYKNGQLLDKNKGLERTKGYYWKDEESIKTFNRLLQNKNSLLPESAKRLQEGLLFLKDILNNY